MRGQRASTLRAACHVPRGDSQQLSLSARIRKARERTEVCRLVAAKARAAQERQASEAPAAEGAPELDPLRRALQAMEEAEMTPKEKRASLRQRGVAT